MALVLSVALPGTAVAATVRVVPYSEERPDPGGGCAKISTCPEDMLVFTAAPGESNNVSFSFEVAGASTTRSRLIVSDQNPIEAGAGCERIVETTVACTAETVGSFELGDFADRIAAPGGVNGVSGGAGDDILSVSGGPADGGEGDDVVIADNGRGGPGDDFLSVVSGDAGAGNDILRCLRDGLCHLRGGPGNDRLTGGNAGNSPDQLAGGSGSDFLDGRDGRDTLAGGRGDDRLRGGARADVLRGGPGADTLEARELRSLGERTARDDVDCGPGRRDRAVADPRDQVTRCERITAARRRPG